MSVISISGATGPQGATGPIGNTINITGGSYSYTSSSLFTLNIPKTTYNVLGEDVEVSGHKDAITAMYISMVNISGSEFYEEVKKQGISFPSEIDDVIKKRLVIHDRDKKLNSIL